jgi:hypothetical protein
MNTPATCSCLDIDFHAFQTTKGRMKGNAPCGEPKEKRQLNLDVVFHKEAWLLRIHLQLETHTTTMHLLRQQRVKNHLRKAYQNASVSLTRPICSKELAAEKLWPCEHSVRWALGLHL